MVLIMFEIRKRKNEIREKYKSLRAALDPKVKAEWDEAVCRSFISSATYRFATVLLLYAPKPDEVDVLPIALQALDDGKRVAFPRCIPDTHDMTFHFVSSLSQLVSGSYGLREPSPDLEKYDRSSPETAAYLIPALVYDLMGYRIGYGKGYYDRYLSSFTGSKVGTVYSEYIVESLPRGRYDLSVDFIVTERGIRVR